MTVSPGGGQRTLNEWNTTFVRGIALIPWGRRDIWSKKWWNNYQEALSDVIIVELEGFWLRLFHHVATPRRYRILPFKFYDIRYGNESRLGGASGQAETMEGRHPAVTIEHLFPLIVRSHLVDLLQGKEGEDRRRFDCDRGYAMFTTSVKKESRFTEPNYLYICL